MKLFGRLFIFTLQLDAEQLASTLIVKQYEVLLLHGDMDQAERNKVITKFKKQEVNIMVATDVAGKYIIYCVPQQEYCFNIVLYVQPEV